MTDTFTDYSAIPAYNATVVKAGLKSMRHMRYAMLYPRTEPTPAMRWGKIVHTAVLEPERFAADYAVWGGGAKRGGAYEEFLASANGREVITLAEKNDAQFMAACALENPDAARLLKNLTAREASVTFTIDDHPCKGRIDGIGPGYILDLKTAGDIDKRNFERSAYGLGYHVQMGMYWWGQRKAAKLDTLAVFVVALEADPPYDCIVYQCTREFLERGLLEASRIINEYEACKRANHFPGQAYNVMELELPGYARPDVELE